MFKREFEVKAVNDGEHGGEGFDEVRFSNEESQENFVLRLYGSERGKFERGAVYNVSFTKKESAPAGATVIAEVPAEDAGSLPASAEIKKGKS